MYHRGGPVGWCDVSRTTTDRFDWTSDLVLVAVLTVVSAGVLLGPDLGASVAALVGVPFLLFFPGYAVVSALFPEQPGELAGKRAVRVGDGGPGWAVRVAFSLLLSGLVAAVGGVLLSWTVGIRLGPAVVLLCAVTFVGLGGAALRRRTLTLTRRAAPLAGSARGALPFGGRRRTIALAVAVLALVATIGIVGVAPVQGESFTESYVLTEGENGDLVADGYPSEFVAGESQSLHVGIENHEFRPVTYEVEIAVQEVDEDGDVVAEERVDQYTTELAHGENDVSERQIAPTMTGEDLRLQFHVFGDGAGEAAAPDRTLHLWIDVVED